MHTTRVVESHDIIWLKSMFFEDDTSGVIDLEALEAIESGLELEIGAELGPENANDITNACPSYNQPNQPGGRVKWNSPIVTGHSEARMSCSEYVIRTPERLKYAPAVELRYLGEMVELDNVELANTYMSL